MYTVHSHISSVVLQRSSLTGPKNKKWDPVTVTMSHWVFMSKSSPGSLPLLFFPCDIEFLRR